MPLLIAWLPRWMPASITGLGSEPDTEYERLGRRVGAQETAIEALQGEKAALAGKLSLRK